MIGKHTNTTLKQKRSGDTLIEVMFAFAILGALIGLAFTGVISAHKSSTSALERTQALEAAQYQAEALKMYQSSLQWGNNGLPAQFTFLGNVAPSGTPTDFCMTPTPSGTSQNWWAVTPVASGNCHGVASGTGGIVNPGLAGLNNNQVTIKLKCIDTTTSANLDVSQSGVSCNSADAAEATVTVSWTNAANIPSTVKNIVILTKNQ